MITQPSTGTLSIEQESGAWASIVFLAPLYPKAAITIIRNMKLNKANCSQTDWGNIVAAFGCEEELNFLLNDEAFIEATPVKKYVVWSEEHVSNILCISGVNTFEALTAAEKRTGYGCSSVVQTNDIGSIIEAVNNECNATFLSHEL